LNFCHLLPGPSAQRLATWSGWKLHGLSGGLATGPLFVLQLAVVTFGGAYGVLGYMAQQAIQGFGWLSPGEMADGLGLAETTPGPLIMVTQFVGFLAAFRHPEPFSPRVAGELGAALTTWVAFAPCFLRIVALAPWIERLQHAPRPKGGLAALTAAVVAVVANLSVWLHVLFHRVPEIGWVLPSFRFRTGPASTGAQRCWHWSRRSLFSTFAGML
jgi:chromate transport protein ChrA